MGARGAAQGYTWGACHAVWARQFRRVTDLVDLPSHFRRMFTFERAKDPTEVIRRSLESFDEHVSEGLAAGYSSTSRQAVLSGSE